MTVKRLFVDGPYGQLHCRVAAGASASGRPVMCLHMSPKSSWLFSDVLAPLSQQRFALAMDYPGHGESNVPPAQPHITIEDYARCVWSAIDELCPGPVHFIGSHTGAMVAVEAAYQRPQDTLGIVSHSAPLFTADETAAFEKRYGPIPLDEAGTRFDLLWRRVIEHRGPGMPLELCAASFAENLRSGEAYEWGHRAAFAYADDYPTRLASLAQPILLLNVNDDMREHSRRADALMRNGRRVEKPAWGHGFFSVHAAEVATLCNTFFNEVEDTT